MEGKAENGKSHKGGTAVERVCGRRLTRRVSGGRICRKRQHQGVK